MQNQWDMFPKCCHLCTGTLLKTVSPEILAMPLSRNKDEVSVLRVCLYFYRNIHKPFFNSFFMLCFSKSGMASHPIPLTLNPALPTIFMNFSGDEMGMVTSEAANTWLTYAYQKTLWQSEGYHFFLTYP